MIKQSRNPHRRGSPQWWMWKNNKGVLWQEALPSLVRFWSKVLIKGPDECWLWCAALDDKGYGLFKIERRMQKAHRIAWRMTNGAILDEHVLHRCDVPACVNPAHLFLGTQSDNMADCAAKGRGNTQNGKGATGQPGVWGSLPLNTGGSKPNTGIFEKAHKPLNMDAKSLIGGGEGIRTLDTSLQCITV